MSYLASTAKKTLCASAMLLLSWNAVFAEDLPSWNKGVAKDSIVRFVTAVTTEGSTEYVEPADRIAVFDNDGTLWSEQPMYVQLAFALDRVKTLAAEHPEWNKTEPFRSAIAGDMKSLAASGTKGLLEIVAATHSGMSSDEFTAIANDWIKSAKHPITGKSYTAMTYKPMRELIDYLKLNGFKVFIVSGGGTEFMRPWTEDIYSVPPENVVGSSVKTKYEIRNGKPAVVRLPDIDFINDGEGKPVGISRFIGKRPIAAFGNSDGDLQMLEWTTSGEGSRFGLIVHHDDEDREVAYDRNSAFGKLDRGLSEGPKHGWTIVSVKNDWKTVFPE